jgi:hypothetical protein
MKKVCSVPRRFALGNDTLSITAELSKPFGELNCSVKVGLEWVLLSGLAGSTADVAPAAGIWKMPTVRMEASFREATRPYGALPS